MGMYTELSCAFELKKETPEQVIEVLRFMVRTKTEMPRPLPDHSFFGTSRWQMMLGSDSYYFKGQAHSTVLFDDAAVAWFVTIRCNFKNYEHEIERFIDWITPHIDAMDGAFLGYCRYEETEVPTLIYHPNRFFKPDVPESVVDG
jgi:hypothetical protein